MALWYTRSMKELNKEILEGSFQRVYLLYGPESYLRLQYMQRLCDAVVPGDDTINRSRFEGRGIRESEIAELAETMPMCRDHRLILVKDSGFFKNKTELLADYLDDLPPYLVLVFSEEEVDKRSRLYKQIEKNGRVTEFPRQSEAVLLKWCAQIFARAGKEIEPAALHAFLQEVGEDMNALKNEADKLIDYTGDRPVITRADLAAVTSHKAQNRIFDMIRASSEGRTKESLSMYADLLALKEAPMRILYLLTREFRVLLLVEEGRSRGRSESEIAKDAGIPPFAVKKYRAVLARYSAEDLTSILAALVRTEEDIKNGRITDRLAVELILATLC